MSYVTYDNWIYYIFMLMYENTEVLKS